MRTVKYRHWLRLGFDGHKPKVSDGNGRGYPPRTVFSYPRYRRAHFGRRSSRSSPVLLGGERSAGCLWVALPWRWGRGPPQLLELRPLPATENLLNVEQHYHAPAVQLAASPLKRSDAINNKLFIRVVFSEKFVELLFESTKGSPALTLRLHEFVEHRIDTLCLQRGQADLPCESGVCPPSGR
jgi:hypothetical protein